MAARHSLSVFPFLFRRAARSTGTRLPAEHRAAQCVGAAAGVSLAGFSVRAASPVSPVHEGATPGSYAPAPGAARRSEGSPSRVL